MRDGMQGVEYGTERGNSTWKKDSRDAEVERCRCACAFLLFARHNIFRLVPNKALAGERDGTLYYPLVD
eukprot:scaffold19286_cov146-Isochrysis_galbana.AAC.4